MLDAWGDHPAVRETVEEASAALGEDIGALIHGGPKEALALTTNTQPVMLVAGVACWRVWRAEGGALPAAVAGHSLGEYAALVAADALPLAQAASACIGRPRWAYASGRLVIRKVSRAPSPDSRSITCWISGLPFSTTNDLSVPMRVLLPPALIAIVKSTMRRFRSFLGQFRVAAA